MSVSRTLRLVLSLGGLVVAASLSGCLTTKSYIDPSLPVLARSELPAVQQPRPVSVLFEFRTKNNLNARATNALKQRVLSDVTQSGMFEHVSSTMDTGESGVLKLIIDNEADTKGAIEKGVGTGLTFGLAGNVVTDNYICTASYTFAGQSVQTTVQHALHSTVGVHAAPVGMQPAKSPADGVNQIVDQLVWHALKQLEAQHAFGS
jgi:hypothetical protein